MEDKTLAKLIETPLAELHRGKGARMGDWFGCALPTDWGDPAREQAFATHSVALIDKNYRAYLTLSGPDRVRYLNAILTNNIKDLPLDRGIVSLLLNPQGRILAEIETYALPDKLICVSYAMIRERLIQWLHKYIIMDDVTLTDETERYGTLALEGPKAGDVVQEITGLDIATMPELASVQIQRFREGDGLKDVALPPNTSCRIVKRSPGGTPGADFIIERQHLIPLWKLLLDAVRAHGGGPMGYAALSAQRLDQGIPWFGYDFGEKQIPHEAGLHDSHISYTKGCYTGQEIVERVRSRGQVNRRRVSLEFSGTQIPDAGTPLTMDGKEAGFVTRAAQSWSTGKVSGMGYVRKEFIEAGNILQWSGGNTTVIGR